jgi:hypothetical protein
MTDFLLGHVLNQEPILSIDTGPFEISYRELGETVMEEIELNPFLVQSEVLQIW